MLNDFLLVSQVLIAFIALLFAIDSYVKRHLSEDDREFRVSIAYLIRKNAFRARYKSLLNWALNISDNLYGKPFSPKALNVSTIIAIFYSYLLISLAWILSGNNYIGNIEVFVPVETFFNRLLYVTKIFIFLLGIFLFTFIFTSIFFAIDDLMHRQRNFITNDYKGEFLKNYKYSRVLIYISYKISDFFGFLLIFFALFASLILLTLPSNIAIVSSFLFVAVAVGVKVASLPTGKTSVQLPICGFLGGVIVSFVLDINFFYGGIIGSGVAFYTFFYDADKDIPSIHHLSGLFAIFLITLESFLFIAYISTDWRINQPNYYTEKWLISIIQKYYLYSKPNIEVAFSIVLIIIIIPAFNGFWDFISFSMTRVLGKRIYNLLSSNKSTISLWAEIILIILLDMFIAVFIFITMIITFILGMNLINNKYVAVSSNEYLFSTIVFLKEISNAPILGQYIWVWVMLFTSIIPSILNMIIALTSAFMVSYMPRNKQLSLSRSLIEYPIDKISIRKAGMFVAFMWPIGIVATLVLTYTAWFLLQLIFPNILLYVHDLLSWAQ